MNGKHDFESHVLYKTRFTDLVTDLENNNNNLTAQFTSKRLVKNWLQYFYSAVLHVWDLGQSKFACSASLVYLFLQIVFGQHLHCCAPDSSGVLSWNSYCSPNTVDATEVKFTVYKMCFCAVPSGRHIKCWRHAPPKIAHGQTVCECCIPIRGSESLRHHSHSHCAV